MGGKWRTTSQHASATIRLFGMMCIARCSKVGRRKNIIMIGQLMTYLPLYQDSLFGSLLPSVSNALNHDRTPSKHQMVAYSAGIDVTSWMLSPSVYPSVTRWRQCLTTLQPRPRWAGNNNSRCLINQNMQLASRPPAVADISESQIGQVINNLQKQKNIKIFCIMIIKIRQINSVILTLNC